MAKIDFPVATADGQEFTASTGVVYTYVGTPPAGYWSAEVSGGGGGAVDSVNSKTGVVVLDAADVGAATTAQGVTADTATQPGDDISTLNNDANYITSTEADALPYVETTGDNMTGDLTLGTDKITLNAADGRITAVGINLPKDSSTIVGPFSTSYIEMGGIFDIGSASAVRVFVAGTEKAQLNSSGQVLVGTTNATTVGVISSKLQVEDTNYNASQTIKRNSNDGSPPATFFVKSRGTTIGSTVAVQKDDALGSVRFCGFDNSNAVEGAAIQANVDATPSTGVVPTRLAFYTSSTGGPVERARINQNGDLLIGGLLPSAANITLASDGSASFDGTVSSKSYFAADRDYERKSVFSGSVNGVENLNILADGSIYSGNIAGSGAAGPGNVNFELNGSNGSATFAGPVKIGGTTDANEISEYEEGTWTPNVGGNATYTVQTGSYTKIGRVVIAKFAIIIATLGTGSNQRIENLPFGVTGAEGECPGNTTLFDNLAFSAASILPYGGAGSTRLFFNTITGGGSNGTNLNTVIFQDGSRIEGAITYFTD